MLSCAPIQGHVGGLVDVSHSAFLLSDLWNLTEICVDSECLYDSWFANGHF